MVISDVLGDPLDIIGSGPTVDDTGTPAEALAILEKFGSRGAGIAAAVFDYLQAAKEHDKDARCPTTNLVIGNNATAVEAARREAAALGYEVSVMPTVVHEGYAEDVGQAACASAAAESQAHRGVSDQRWRAGREARRCGAARPGRRNQQLVLAAAESLAVQRATGFALLSAGTDGEDGPTDAAGAFVDENIIAAAATRGLNIDDYLQRNDAYHFFQPLDALIKTGPTHTNVCDVRVVLKMADVFFRPVFVSGSQVPCN